MNFTKMYQELETITKQYRFPMSKVYTTWDGLVKKKLYKLDGGACDDYALRTQMHNRFSQAGEESLEVVKRYFRFKNYKRAKSIADEFND